ncbi:uncharacterized protein H6S33_000440 [Morchella sextelata]|uniref:uncharacterized protein n=1 Tax=Morchella sextelata TaxID=1174677 RepID=UPI001D05BD3F|nr:uncharacterized protein H6S33_000440 [Morchella sextelata]KAH0614804.1 hypothetical protein H6S33_000440 [Morchella sextelata]
MGYRSLTRRIKRLLSTRPNFMAMHYYYLGLCILLGSILIYIPGGVPFVDAIFFASGAATQSGLNTIDLNKVNTYQQIITIHWFEKRFEHIVLEAKENRELRRTISLARRSKEVIGNDHFIERGISHPRSPDDIGVLPPLPVGVAQRTETSHAVVVNTTRTTLDEPGITEPTSPRIIWDVPIPARAEGGVEEKNDIERPINFEPPQSSIVNRSSLDTIQDDLEISRVESRRSRPRSRSRFGARDNSTSRSMARSRRGRSRSASPIKTPYLSYTPSIGRNSQFYDLNDDQRNELGGIEYRSLKTLSWILIGYYVIIHFLGIIVLVPWVLRSQEYGDLVKDLALNKVWWGIYTAMTCFNDVGFTLTPDSFISFQKAAFILIFCGLLIVVGNTGFPLFLRFIIWILFVLCPEKYVDTKDELNFLLDHPRRCFTLLFPSRPTWWLFGILVGLNLADVILFLVLDYQTPVVKSLPVGLRIVNAFFQAVSTRTSGTASIPLGELHPGIQCSYLVMMYISVLPLAISIRRTNVYEEHSLGIYVDNTPQASDGDEGKYIMAHVRRQLEFDLWYVFLGLFLICVAEGGRIADANDYKAFTAFSVFFEVVSAYGTVGLSLGYPGLNCSLSGTFTPFSKLVIIAMEIRGRHRGLPYDVDRAVLLPSVNTPDSTFAPDGTRLQRITNSRQSVHIAED